MAFLSVRRGVQWLTRCVLGFALGFAAQPAALADTVLLVDESTAGLDARSVYEDVLEALNVPYDVWSVPEIKREPTFQHFLNYDAIIWFTGDEQETAGPHEKSESDLARYLLGGGRLFISSSGYFNVAGYTGLMEGYLGIAGATRDVGFDAVVGDGFFNNQGPYEFDCAQVSSALNDRLSPTRNASAAYRNSARETSAGVAYRSRGFATLYVGFPVECIRTFAQQVKLMSASLTFMQIEHRLPQSEPPDEFEPDNTFEQASPLLVTAQNVSPFVQEHDINALDDEDWFQFVAHPGTPYEFVLESSRSDVHLVFELYDANLELVERRELIDETSLVFSSNQLGGLISARVFSPDFGGTIIPYAASVQSIDGAETTILGTVMSGASDPICGATIYVCDVQTKSALSASAPIDNQGRYALSFDAGVSADVCVCKSGFEGSQIPDVVFPEITDAKELDAILSPSGRNSHADHDCPGNGPREVIIDRAGSQGAEGGIYAWSLASGWTWIHAGPSKILISGDISGDGQSDVVLDLVYGGVWVWDGAVSGFTSKVTAEETAHVVVGDLDGNGRDDIVYDVVGGGLMRRMNDSYTWQVHGGSADHMATADVDGDGDDELVVDFDDGGIWIWNDDTAPKWSKVHNSSAEHIATGDIDGDGRVEVIIDFVAGGIWVWEAEASSSGLTRKISRASADHIVVGDVDGGGVDDVVFDVAGSGKIWRWSEGSSSVFYTQSAQHMAIGDIDGNGAADVVMDLAVGVTWIKMNNSNWMVKVGGSNGYNAEQLGVGDIDAVSSGESGRTLCTI